MALAEVPLGAVEAGDAMVFPAPRPAFLRAWIGSCGHVGCALMRDGGLVGWGVVRPCPKGCKIGPLGAHHPAPPAGALSPFPSHLPARGTSPHAPPLTPRPLPL